jgi:hypothetical protein
MSGQVTIVRNDQRKTPIRNLEERDGKEIHVMKIAEC